MMTRKLKRAAVGVAVAAALAACGGGVGQWTATQTKQGNPVTSAGGAAAPGGTSAAPKQPAPVPGAAVEGEKYELRLLGVNGAGLDTALLAVADVEATANGEALPVTLDAGTIDLANPGQAWKVARITVPPGTDKVQVKLQLDDFGGYAGTDGAGALDLRGAPLRFDLTVADMRARGRAVAQLDLGRSLKAAGEDTKILLPHFTIYY